jgi:sugar phosphate isomerase/epimerase
MRKIALSLVSLWDFIDDKKSIDNHLLAEFAPRWGFEYIEPMFFEGGNKWEKYRKLKKLFDNAELKVAAIYGGTWGGTAEDYKKNLEEKKRLLKVCQFFDSNILVGSGTHRFEGGLDQCVKQLKELSPAAEDYNVKLSLEPHMHNQLQYIPDYVYILEKVKNPLVGICLDTGHFYGSGVDMHSLFDIYIDRINHVHLKDASRAGGHFFVQFGEGKIDNEGLLKRLVENNYQGFYSLELEVGAGSKTELYLKKAKKLYSQYEIN